MLCYQFRLIQMNMMIPFNMLNGYLREERCVKGCATKNYRLIGKNIYHWIGDTRNIFADHELQRAVISPEERNSQPIMWCCHDRHATLRPYTICTLWQRNWSLPSPNCTVQCILWCAPQYTWYSTVQDGQTG